MFNIIQQLGGKKKQTKKTHFRKPLSLKFLSTVDPWKTQIWIAQLHLHMDFFQ